MKIAYIGNFRPRHSTENHLLATLEDMGHSVYRFQEDENRASGIAESVIELGADLLLYTRTWGFIDGPEAGLRMLKDLDEAGIPTASYHLDLYIGISREGTLDNDPFWRTKYVFTPDGAPESQKAFMSKGINHFYIRPGVFKPECVYGQPLERFAFDVAFVGSQGGPGWYHDEWPYRGELVNWLRRTYGERFGKFGYPQETVRNEDLNSLYASAKVIVGDSLCLDFKHPYYWSDRVYETMGRGGFIIHPYIKGLDDEFTDGEHLRFYEYGNYTQLKELIDYYIGNYDERERIRLAGHLKVKNECTYHERLSEMFAILWREDPILSKKLEESLSNGKA